MLCSMSSSKSGSNWLDRLRSSKGFPVANDLDLEHFLNPNSDPSLSSDTKVSDAVPEVNCSNSNSDSTSLDKKSVADRKKNVADSGGRKHRQKEDWFGIMSSVLAELFNMGDSGGIQRIRGSDERRSSRKQQNPKICLFSASASVDDSCLDGVRKAEGVPAMSPSSADNSVAEVKETGDWLKQKQGKSASLTLEEEKSQTDLLGYSRVEVTVIDTSTPMWKSEKLLFRKGNVWKVRDKKWKLRNVSTCRKKRNGSQSDKEVGGKKKRKLSLAPLNAYKEPGRKELVIPSNENTRREPCKETPDDISQVPKRRHQFSRSPRKPASRNSPVFNVQSVSTGRKNVVHLPKSSVKDI